MENISRNDIEFDPNLYEGAGIIFITPDNKIVVLKEKKSGKWGFCKGRRKSEDQDSQDTATREAFEELGLRENNYELDNSPFSFPRSPYRYIFMIARLKVDIFSVFSNKNTLQSGHDDYYEISEVRTITLKELIDQIDTYNYNIYMRLLRACILMTRLLTTSPQLEDIESTYRSYILNIKPKQRFYNSALDIYPENDIIIQKPETKPRFYNSALGIYSE